MAAGLAETLAAALQVAAHVASVFNRGQLLRHAAKPACRSASETAGRAFQSALT